MNEFNDIGISRQLDWPRIAHLFRGGLLGALLTLIGDMILGWGVEGVTLEGLGRMLSAYTGTSDGGILPRLCWAFSASPSRACAISASTA